MRNIINKELFISVSYIIFVVVLIINSNKSFADGLHPFAIVGLEYTLAEKSAMFYSSNDESFSTHTKDLPTDRFMLQVGLEYEKFSFGYQHLSGATGGCPLNCGEAEYYRDSLFINYKWGGK